MFGTIKVTSYRAFGLNILSEFVLPELKHISPNEYEPDLTIKKEELKALWSKNVQTDSYYYIKENLCMVRVPEVAIYKIKNGKMISFSPFEGASDEQIKLFLLGTCMGVALMQRKILPIHGSCIAIDGKAYAIVGDSGAGKSTLATAFINKGFPLLTDDVIAVTLLKDNIPTVIPSYPQQKLWQESLDQFGIESSRLNPIIDREEKFAIPVKENFIDKPMPLAGIFELNKTGKLEIEILPVQQLERFPMLYYNTYRKFMINRSGLLDWHFKFSAKMVNHLEFHRISRPESRFTADELVDQILKTINKEKRPFFIQNMEKENSV